MTHQKTSLVIRKNHMPVKLVFDSEKRASQLTQRLQRRFPENVWSVGARFPLEGTD